MSGIIREDCSEAQNQRPQENLRYDLWKKSGGRPQKAHLENGRGALLEREVKVYLKASNVLIGLLARVMTVLRRCLLLCILRAAAVSSSSVVSPSSG